MEDFTILLDIIDQLTTIGLLVYVWTIERNRANDSYGLIVKDWLRRIEQDFIDNARQRAKDNDSV